MKDSKLCTDCNQEKSLNDFYISKNHSKGVMVYCKDCFNRRCIKRWIDRKIAAVDYKGGQCERCKLKLLDSHYSVFEFHHIIPYEKDVDWTKLRLKNIDKIHQELDKCMLVCANCHRIIHAKLRDVVLTGIEPV